MATKKTLVMFNGCMRYLLCWFKKTNQFTNRKTVGRFYITPTKSHNGVSINTFIMHSIHSYFSGISMQIKGHMKIWNIVKILFSTLFMHFFGRQCYYQTSAGFSSLHNRWHCLSLPILCLSLSSKFIFWIKIQNISTFVFDITSLFQ